MGGPSFGLKRAIDEGLVAGPRIYPSGAVITVTGGHGDFRQAFELPRGLGNARTRMEVVGGSMVADSPDEVRLRVREQLMLGATQIKLTAGGGVASPHSPLDAVTFTESELRAAVEAAENWGTYVTVHAYTPASIQRAIAAGVRCIEHGHRMNGQTAKLILTLARIPPAVAQQKRRQVVACDAFGILRVIASALEIAHGLARLIVNVDGCQVAAAQKPRELHGITAVRLNAIARSQNSRPIATCDQCPDQSGASSKRLLQR